MRKVLYRRLENGVRTDEFKYEAFFHQWAVKRLPNKESEIVAIVEVSSGNVTEVPFYNIKFVNPNTNE